MPSAQSSTSIKLAIAAGLGVFYIAPLEAETKNSKLIAPQVGGILQTQFAYAQSKNDQEKSNYNSFELKRLRLSVTRSFDSEVTGVFVTNLKPSENVSLRAAYLRWTATPYFNFQAGIDRPQTTQEANTSAAELITPSVAT